MTDVLFIYVDVSAHTGYTTGLGIASLSAFVRKHGYSTSLAYYRTEADTEYLRRKLEQAAPTVVGMYAPSSAFASVGELARLVRRITPSAFLALGGPHATLCPETLVDVPDLDAFCVGYGERPLLALLQRLSSGATVADLPGWWLAARHGDTGQVVQNAPWPAGENDDELLAYDYDLFLNELARFPDFDRSLYRLEVMLKRSCPYVCAFCSSKALRRACGGRSFSPSPTAALAVINEALGSTGLKRVAIHDDVLMLDHDWFREFMQGYAREIRAPFWCNARIGSFTGEDLELLKAANVERVYTGIESGNEFIRNQVIHKGVSTEAIRESFRLLHAHRLTTVSQNIVGLPHETPRSFLDTVKINAEVRPTYFIVSVFYPYPKTDLETLCVEEGLYSAAPSTGARERDDTILDLPGFPRREILFYKRRFGALIKYQQLRNRRPWLFPVPLTPRTSHLVARVMGLAEGSRRLANRARRRIGRRRPEPSGAVCGTHESSGPHPG